MNKIFEKHKKIAIILPSIIVLLVIILAFGSEFLNNNKNRINTNKEFDEINISEYRMKSICDKKIKQRIIKIIGNKVFIGETDKQIENEYYDVFMYIQENRSLVICLNKLWKNFNEKLYQEEYVTEISESIKDVLAINVPLNQIYDYILSGYLVAKNSDNNVKENKEYVLDLEEYVIKGYVLNKEFVMSIYRKQQ